MLAYHDVVDVDAFTRQIEWLARHFNPVSADDIATAVQERRALPPRSAWVTFDDGHPAVVERAQPVLERMGVRATLFVCPGLVASQSPYWWEVVEQALAAGARERVGGREWSPLALVTHLKTVPDAHRREIVARFAANAATGDRVQARQLTTDSLQCWLDAGHSIGNHTWDHPCLDMCTPDEQADQIVRADTWLRHLAPDSPRLFAYPNGDWTPEAERALRDLGYDLAVVFDHRLAANPPERWRVSRLRVAADAPLPRFRAILSGANPALFGLRRSRTKPRAAR